MRSKIDIIQIRAADVQRGDVVNRRGPNKDGWMEVDRMEQLEGGGFVVHDEKERESFTAEGYDLIWMQVVHVLHENSHLPVG